MKPLLAPAAPPRPSGVATRTVYVSGVAYHLEPNVYRETIADGWRVQIDRKGERRRKKYFADRGHGGTKPALDAAHAWLNAQDVRPAFEQIGLSRKDERSIELRRFVAEVDGRPCYRFELRIRASKGAWQRSWMTEPLGIAPFVTQRIITNAIARLHGRWFAYERNKLHMGNARALDEDYSEAPPAIPAMYSTRLLVRDVKQWTHNGRGITFMQAAASDAGVVAKPTKLMVARAARKKAAQLRAENPAVPALETRRPDSPSVSALASVDTGIEREVQAMAADTFPVQSTPDLPRQWSCAYPIQACLSAALPREGVARRIYDLIHGYWEAALPASMVKGFAVCRDHLDHFALVGTAHLDHNDYRFDAAIWARILGREVHVHVVNAPPSLKVASIRAELQRIVDGFKERPPQPFDDPNIPF